MQEGGINTQRRDFFFFSFFFRFLGKQWLNDDIFWWFPIVHDLFALNIQIMTSRKWVEYMHEIFHEFIVKWRELLEGSNS